MMFFRRLSLVIFASAAAALLAPTPAHAAAVVSISHDQSNLCGRGFVFCNGRQAYSLTEIENGTLQVPVFPLLPSEVVIVNDTGHTVTNLQFSLTTLELFSFDVQCMIQSTARQYFNSCNVAKGTTGFSRDPFGVVSAHFTFTANNDGGIPDGAYFDITTVGFLPGGYLCGGGSGSGGSGNGGSGSGGSGSGSSGSGGSGSGGEGPPQQ